MNVLVIGGGGREHALAWKAAQSPLVERVFVAPGNAGTAAEEKVTNVDLGAEDVAALVRFAAENAIELTIVGPEQPLVAGVADDFAAAGMRCFGPGAAAARLEGSKAFAKRFLERHGIPTAGYTRFGDSAAALRHLRGQSLPVVIKADGLAAGKGVVIVRTIEEGERALRAMLDEGRFGEAGRSVVIEEFLEGEEASFIALVDGRRVLPLATSQDHKARDDGDRGPNTGGMGAYSPAPLVDETVYRHIIEDIVSPTVDGLAEDGIAYRGFLYAGLMIGLDGRAKVLEFNCRCGDPETQPIMFRLRSDLVAHCLAAFDGTLGDSPAEWDPRAALGVVVASGGYPDAYAKGKVITGLESADSFLVKVFHAGTRRADGRVLTDGGRVLCAVALGTDVGEAQRRAYAAVRRIDFEGAFWRNDIGYRAVAREVRAEAARHEDRA
jgi:phosphoribosylamine--glycine ligase